MTGQEGLARFATQRYEGATTTDLFAHLTNASINKQASPSEDEFQYKWKLSTLLDRLRADGADVDALWTK